VAIGNDELGGPLGPQATCPACGKLHDVQSLSSTDGTPSVLQMVKCDTGSTYLVGIGGQAWSGAPSRDEP
jgi:hypothetical protein